VISLSLTDEQAPVVWTALVMEHARGLSRGTDLTALDEVIEEMLWQARNPTPEPFPLEVVPAERDGRSEGRPDNSAGLEREE
jgi:hypothetical protein